MVDCLDKRVLMRGLLAAGLCCLPLVVFGSARPARAQSVAPEQTALAHVTLEQAVAKVQSQTHGKVLRAGTRQYGNMTEYLIKVLTPDGHVRVIPVRSKPVRTSEKTHKETR